MTIEQALHLVPSSELFVELRESEEDLLADITGKPVALRVAYRMVCHWLVTHRRFPAYLEIPERLRLTTARTHWGTVNDVAFRAIVRRTKTLLLQLAERHIAMQPYMQCRLFADETSPADFEDRIAYYRRENARLEKTYAITPWVSHATPTIRAVYCPELDMTFKNARKAATHLSKITGKEINRSSIRTSIRRQHKCGEVEIHHCDADYLWSLVESGQTLPPFIHLSWRYADDKPAVGEKRSRARVDSSLPLFQAA